MRQHRRTIVTLFLLAASLLAACGPAATLGPTPAPTQPGDDGVLYGEANVEEINILILESFPVQIHVVARGNLPDGCTEIDEVQQERTGQTFRVTITTMRPSGAMCTEALVPFEEAVALDVVGLEAGTYTVDVNGVTGTFELAVDNEPVGEPAPGGEPSGGVPDPPALPALTWHREGGIAGFCDDLAIDASGVIDVSSCGADPSGTVARGRLDEAQLAQLQTWLDTFRPFEVEQNDDAVADAMTIRLAFAGRGTVEPAEADKLAILEFAAEVYATLNGEVVP